MNILVTGGCGFIGSHFIEDVIKKNLANIIVNVDCMTYAANKNLDFDKKHHSYYHIQSDISKNNEILPLLQGFKIDYVVHFAAESHVDNSIKSSDPFVQTNIVGTHNILSSCLSYGKLKKFIHISTDEVFGSLSLKEKSFTKESPYKPNSPYAASKASSDLLVRSYVKTHKFPAIITNCSNNFGPRQFPEKLIPLCLQKLKSKQAIPLYGSGLNVRDWIYVKDHVNAILEVLCDGDIGEQYLIGGENEISNINLINSIVQIYEEITKEKINWKWFEYVEDRKAHDFRYAIDFSDFRKKFTHFNLTPFREAMYNTVKSYL